MNGLTNKLAIGGIFLGLTAGNTALGNEVAVVRTTTIEVKPLISIIMAEPGMVGFGFGVERDVSEQVSGFIDASYAGGDLSSKIEEEMEEDRGYYVDRGQFFALRTGARYYTQSSNIDSWFADGALNYHRSSDVLAFREAKFQFTRDYLTPTIGGGYRWLWNNGLSVRLGASAGYSFSLQDSLSDKATTEDSSEGRDVIEDDISDGSPLYASFDIGLGYSF